MRARRGLAVLALLAATMPAAASDHADPIALKDLNSGITGLFAFPEGEELVIILTVRRSLTEPAPYNLEQYEFSVHLDLHSPISFANAEDLARYGGTVLEPEGISADATIRFRLDDRGDFQQSYPRYEGQLAAAGDIAPAYSGVRDDPFIFPRFFGTNVIAMAVRIPFSAFPTGQRDWLIWGTSTDADSGQLLDHVGRSNRTQLGRLDFLNSLPPSEQVPAIAGRLEQGITVQKGLSHLMTHLMPIGAASGLFEYVFQIRPYDVAPDVMFFTARRAPGFPNGRRLEDDVAALTCAQGDCVLQEVASIEGDWPRATTNDKPFLTDFPYLAPPHPEHAEHRSFDWCWWIFWFVVLALLFWLASRYLRKWRSDETPEVRRYLAR